MATIRPEKRIRKKKKPPKKFRLSYSLVLLFAMLIVGSIAGIVAYNFGKQALEGVNASPAGVKLPSKVSPPTKPKESPKPSPKAQTDGKTSFFLDEAQIIAETKARSQQELGALKRPNFVAKSNPSDRKSTYVKVDRTDDSMRDPLAISANADERIADRISALRQRVYSSSRDRSFENNFERAISNDVNTSLPSLSTPVELTPIRSRWEDRDRALVNPKKINVENIEVLPKPTDSLFTSERQSPKTIEINRR